MVMVNFKKITQFFTLSVITCKRCKVLFLTSHAMSESNVEHFIDFVKFGTNL